MAIRKVDLVVIGAGVYGLAVSKFYLDVHPECHLVVLEKDTCIGGSWSYRRLYPTFWSQIGLGQAEFSDMPMYRPPETLHELYDAKYVAEYLDKYSEQATPDGRPLRDRIILNFTVTKVEKSNGKWEVQGVFMETKTELVFHAAKVMIASGLTSTPKMPLLPNRELFEGRIIHQKDFGSSQVLSSGDKSITVLGGAKSAADMVYASVKAGKKVSWLIRESGSGPAAFLGSEGKGPYKNSAGLGFTRIMGTFQPSLFTPQNWWTRFVHNTTPGRWVLSMVWNMADKVSVEGAKFDRPKALEGFKNLKSSTIVFWSNDSLGLIQHPDFWDTVAQNVQIHRGDILTLDKRVVRLSNGTEIPTDALLCGTGWKHSHDFFRPDQLPTLGLPHPIESPSESDIEWLKIESEADAQVVARFPQLAHPPDYVKKSPTTTPYRLLNCMAPLSEAAPGGDHSIVFLGHIHVANAFRAAAAQALWATAYLDGQLSLPSERDMQTEVGLINAWNRRRYLNNGKEGNYLHYDLVGYTDKLIEQMGLTFKPKGWWQYWFGTRRASDFKEPRAEYLTRVLKREGVGYVCPRDLIGKRWATGGTKPKRQVVLVKEAGVLTYTLRADRDDPWP